MMKEISVKTSSRVELIDITHLVEKVVLESKIKSGLCIIYVPHTTAAVTINENADPSVRRDIIAKLNKVIPFDDNYAHLEGNAAAHIKASIIGPSETILVNGGSLVLGTWQGIYFCEFDGPRNRKVMIKIIEG
ncbi:MAG: secondary thiamine-phosphate synthase enzyme YjbQ [candidate division Zixibacteria bacterium]|nr:secondary thiamine-phosphate synthase enzyme YjbQ [candidate division Zixibacteria bacterium]